MKDDQHKFLTLLGRLPARLTAQQVAWVLGCQPHDIPALLAARLLKPLGNPAVNGIKYFCAADILEVFTDRSWLIRASNAIYQHTQAKNFRNQVRPVSGDEVISLPMAENVGKTSAMK